MAHIIVSKFGDHLPGIRARACHWETGRRRICWSKPRRDVILSRCLACGRHAGPVLASGAGKTKTGGVRTYMRDERAATCQLPAC
jgi:hypothetical protein